MKIEIRDPETLECMELLRRLLPPQNNTEIVRRAIRLLAREQLDEELGRVAALGSASDDTTMTLQGFGDDDAPTSQAV